MLVVCFELMGLPLYVLAAYAKNDKDAEGRQKAPEAALKLYLVGAASTAASLFVLCAQRSRPRVTTSRLAPTTRR